MPKMVISATGDEFFQPDDSYAWYEDMKGILVIPALRIYYSDRLSHERFLG